MTNEQIKIISFFLVLSILVWLIPFIFFVLRCLKGYKAKSTNSVSLESRLMFCSLTLVCAIWCLRFATSYYEEIVLFSSGLSFTEMIFDSLLHALQTMTMNEECSEFITLGKAMIVDIYDEKNIYVYELFFGIYASILDLLAPIMSAATLFSVLTTVFPKLKLKFSFLKKQYHFSELNERSIALAKSIISNNTKFWNRPVIVFTDVYVDNENERSSELYFTAKKIGAICIRDDIVHLKIKTFKEKEIFLLDENESDNIMHLSELNSEKCVYSLSNTFVYVFYQDDSYALVENRIKKDIAEQHKSSAKPPVITRVKEYENLILNLLSKKPLVAPLLLNYKDGLPYPTGDKTDNFNLTIIGSGKIGMQMILSSSWCGQFYGYKLNINVVSNENKEDFSRNINNLYPEFIESAKAMSPILKVFEDDDVTNEPYFNLRYGEYDFNKVSLLDVNCISLTDNNDEEFKIIDSDYFLIAMGNDETNMLAAEKIKKQISICQYQLTKEKRKNIVIAFAVYNQNFNEILRKNSCSFDNDYKIEFYPFGSIEETYSYQNITMVNKDPAAILVGRTYINQTYKEKTIKEKLKTQAEQNEKIYDIMSSKAREVHFKYRIFSAFLCNKNQQSVVGESKNEWENLYDFDNNSIELYAYTVLSEGAKEKRSNVLQYLTWLEHRRWNAYMRSLGFSYDTKKDKNIELKLHACLCECSKMPISGDSEIRLNDLKSRLFDYTYNEKQVSKEGFENCIKKWIRLPKEIEQVKIDTLLEMLDEHFIQKITEITHTKKSESDLKMLFENVVNDCLFNDTSKPHISARYDMLDLFSKIKGLDYKYFDFPQETDTNLIESYREMEKEVH